MHRSALLAAYDHELRGPSELIEAERYVWHRPVWWAEQAGDGFVTYRTWTGRTAPRSTG